MAIVADVANRTGMNSLRMARPSPVRSDASQRLANKLQERAQANAALQRQQSILKNQAARLSGKPSYNVQDIQSLRNVEINPAPKINNVAPSMILGGVAFKALTQQIELLQKANPGLNPWFNVGGGTGGLSYGSNLSQAIGRAQAIEDINVALLNPGQQAASRASAIADELITRGHPGVTEAYNYVRAPTEWFTPLKTALKNIGRVGNATLGFSLIPNTLFTNFRSFMDEWLPPGFQSGGSGAVNNQG